MAAICLGMSRPGVFVVGAGAGVPPAPPAGVPGVPGVGGMTVGPCKMLFSCHSSKLALVTAVMLSPSLDSSEHKNITNCFKSFIRPICGLVNSVDVMILLPSPSVASSNNVIVSKSGFLTIKNWTMLLIFCPLKIAIRSVLAAPSIHS